jgi:hypothetical protein
MATTKGTTMTDETQDLESALGQSVPLSDMLGLKNEDLKRPVIINNLRNYQTRIRCALEDLTLAKEMHGEKSEEYEKQLKRSFSFTKGIFIEILGVAEGHFNNLLYDNKNQTIRIDQ